METLDYSWEEMVPRRVKRIVQKALDDIVPTPEISPKRAERIRTGVVDYVGSVAISYGGKASKVPAGYIAKELLENVEGERDQYVLVEIKGLAGILSLL